MKFTYLACSLLLCLTTTACNSELGHEWNGQRNTLSNVINGNDVVRDNPESMGVVLIEILDIRGRVHSFCTGTIVSSKYVLTAGHCFDENLVKEFDRANIVFDTAIDFRYLKKSTAKVTRRAGHPITHPQYNIRNNWDHDAALLPIKGGLPEGFAPVTLDHDESANYEGQDLVIYGYGKSMDYTGNEVGEEVYRTFGVLRRGQLKVGANFREFPDRYSSVNRSRQLGCQGDSGGPQFLVAKNGVAKQVGINSSVDGPTLANGMRSCAGPGYATKVSYIYDWVQRLIR